MNVAAKKVYKYKNRVQAVVTGLVLSGIEADAKRTGESKSEIAARILADHYKKQKQSTQPG